MPRWKLAFIALAVGRSAVITFAASFSMDQPPGSQSERVLMWGQSAASARTSERAATAGDAQRRGVPLPIEPSVIVEFVPLRLASTEASAGPAKDRAAGVWSCYICNNTASRVIVQRARVFMASPHILPIPDGQSAALFSKRNQASPWRILGGFVKDYGALGAAAAGIAFSGLTAGAGAGVAAQLLTKAVSSAGQAASERTPEYKLYAPLPIQIVLEPGGCAEFDMLSGLVPKAHRHKGVVQ